MEFNYLLSRNFISINNTVTQRRIRNVEKNREYFTLRRNMNYHNANDAKAFIEFEFHYALITFA